MTEKQSTKQKKLNSLFSLFRDITSGQDQWYDSLKKPRFSPPKHIYFKTFSTLQLLSLISAAVFSQYQWEFNVALFSFSIHLLLSLLWMPMFFSYKMVTFSFFDILPAWIFCLIALLLFKIRSNLAYYLLLPEFIWISLLLLISGNILVNNEDTYM